MSSFPLPIRPAVPPQQQQQQQQQLLQQQDQVQQPETDLQLPAAVGSDPLPSVDEEGPAPVSPRPAAVDSIISQVAKWVHTTSGLQPKENHQFWVNDSNIAENLFTIHRSTKHLLDFTSSLIGNHESFMGQRPVPVMSDGDILFMTQLSADISRGVGSISAIRHHGLRAAKKRKTRPDGSSYHHHHREDAIKRLHSGSRSLHHNHNHRRRTSLSHRGGGAGAGAGSSNSEADGGMSCWKCGRTDTPEWRRGPDGEVLCNACGLVYAKQRRKGKGKAVHHSHHSQSGPT